jgi:hypothetical protein
LAYAPLIGKRLRAFRKPHCGSIRIDETYVKIRGHWRYLYRAIDKHGNPVDFLREITTDLDLIRRWLGQKTLHMAIHYSSGPDTSDQIKNLDPLGANRNAKKARATVQLIFRTV